MEEGRRAEAESFARILQGLSRSISPDAIVGAIVEELGIGTAADHVVIVRRRPDARVLEATLVNARTGGSTSSTVFPIGDLEDPPSLDDATERDPVGIPIDVDGDGAPVEIPVDAAPAGRPRLGASVGAVEQAVKVAAILYVNAQKPRFPDERAAMEILRETLGGATSRDAERISAARGPIMASQPGGHQPRSVRCCLAASQSGTEALIY